MEMPKVKVLRITPAGEEYVEEDIVLPSPPPPPPPPLEERVRQILLDMAQALRAGTPPSQIATTLEQKAQEL